MEPEKLPVAVWLNLLLLFALAIYLNVFLLGRAAHIKCLGAATSIGPPHNGGSDEMDSEATGGWAT